MSLAIINSGLATGKIGENVLNVVVRIMEGE